MFSTVPLMVGAPYGPETNATFIFKIAPYLPRRAGGKALIQKEVRTCPFFAECGGGAARSGRDKNIVGIKPQGFGDVVHPT